jgi:hypothetical protein
MTPKYSDTRVLDVVGRLDKNEDGRRILTIELKDDTIVKDFDEIINKALGEMISFKVIQDIDG